MEALAITAHSIISALGRGQAATLTALQAETSGLRPCALPGLQLTTTVGQVDGVETVALPDHLTRFDCRNNRLAEMALQQDGFADHVARARERYGPNRVAVVLGTSTSGVAECERAYEERLQHPDGENSPLPAWFDFQSTHDYYSLADYVRRRLNLYGPTQIISTACSSANKSFAAGARMIIAGLCDAAVVGGVDSLSKLTLLGFNSLELLAPGPCRPNDLNRDGISIAEAGGFALLEKRNGDNAGAPLLLGCGESSDAHHMSAPHPEGVGAKAAMEEALQSANLNPAQIDYVNFHGTASLQNDRVEDAAVADILGREVPCSSTKGYSGHTLGAAGMMEAAICLAALDKGFLPGNLNLETQDPDFRCHILPHNENVAPAIVLSNAFGFGGNNCTVIFARAL